jgi:hypothetical protein
VQGGASHGGDRSLCRVGHHTEAIAPSFGRCRHRHARRGYPAPAPAPAAHCPSPSRAGQTHGHHGCLRPTAAPSQRHGTHPTTPQAAAPAPTPRLPRRLQTERFSQREFHLVRTTQNSPTPEPAKKRAQRTAPLRPLAASCPCGRWRWWSTHGSPRWGSCPVARWNALSLTPTSPSPPTRHGLRAAVARRIVSNGGFNDRRPWLIQFCQHVGTRNRRRALWRRG